MLTKLLMRFDPEQYRVHESAAGHRNPLGRGQLAVFPSGGRRTRSLRIDLELVQHHRDIKRSSHFSTKGETLPPTRSANANKALRASPTG
jgi:hypothetical protein